MSKDYSNYNELTDRMFEFTDLAPEHLRGRKLPIHLLNADWPAIAVRFDCKIDLDKVIVYDSEDDEYNNPKLPTMHELCLHGVAREWFPYKQSDIYAANENEEFVKRGNLRIRAIKKFFKENGLNVSTEALKHNYSAWLAGWKSGYRDEKSGVHVFTPAGDCNEFNIHVTELHPLAADWQTTYIC